MLSLFNKFLSRIRTPHPILSNKHVFVVLLQYLEGEDLFQVFQVSFICKTTIESVPTLYITLLKFRMNKSNQSIDELKHSARNPKTSSSVVPKFVQRAFLPTFPCTQFKKQIRDFGESKPDKGREPVDLNDEKWVAFAEHFKEFAKAKGFKIVKKNEFETEQEWNKYKSQYIGFYHTYVDYIKQERTKMAMLEEERRLGLTGAAINKYKSFIRNLNFKFHTATNYRYFPNRKERTEKPSDSIILV